MTSTQLPHRPHDPCDPRRARRSRRPSYAALTSSLALVVAVAGSGAAVAAGLAADSVGSAQVRNDSLTGADVKESTLVLPAPARVFAGQPVQQSVLLEGPETIASVSFTAPRAGFVTITAQACFRAGEAGTYLTATVLDNGNPVGGTYWDPGDADGNYDQTQVLTVTRPVTKGAHTFSLRLEEGSVSSVFTRSYLPSVTAQYFPTGTAGPVQLPD